MLAGPNAPLLQEGALGHLAHFLGSADGPAHHNTSYLLVAPWAHMTVSSMVVGVQSPLEA